MKQTVFRRAIALLLCVSCVLCGGIAVTGAQSNAAEQENDKDKDTSVSSTSLADVRELLNAVPYKDYISKEVFKLADPANASIVVNALNFNADKTNAKVKKVAINEKTGNAQIIADDYVAKDGEILGLYCPDLGEVTFDVSVPETAKYSIAIEYYPAKALIDSEGKSTSVDKTGSIERILKIDGKVPFAEARYLVLTKTWKNIYTIKMATVSTDANGNNVYEDVEPYRLRAEKCGLNYSIAANNASITIELPEDGWTSEQLKNVSEEDFRFFTTDIDDNEIRCTMERVPELRRYECKDVDGFYSDSFEFVLEAGTRQISLDAKSQSMVIKSITLFPQPEKTNYEDIKAGYEQAGYNKGQDIIKIEAEFPFATSSQTIYPVEDSSSAATSPVNTHRTMLNTIGGEKWQTSGQWVRYKFNVNNDGLYRIVTRYRQNVNDGMFSSRVLSLYSEGLNEGDPGYYNGIPFKQASNLRFEYSTTWQVAPLKYAEEIKIDETHSQWENRYLEFYFKAGVTYTMELEVALGDMGQVVSDVNTSLTNINNYYLNIIKLTGAEPDSIRNYGFYRIMPDTMQGLIIESWRLADIANTLRIIAGDKSSNIATLEHVSWLLNEMGRDEDNVAKYLEELKTYIGTLGTWINDNKTQPLQLDYIVIQNCDQPLPKADANFFEAMGHEISKFIQSFRRNYDRMGATNLNTDTSDKVEVWLAKGRDQTQVIRNLINNDFTPNPEYGHLVDLKLVAGATLLPSILSNSGPDVYIGVSEDNIINYAIRGALMNIENFEGFYDLTSQYLMEKKTINDYILELKAQSYIIEGEGSNTVKAMSSDGVAMYTISYTADGSGETRDRDNKFVNGFDADGSLYQLSSTFSGKTYTYKNVLDESGNKVINPNAQFNEAAMYVLGLPDSDNVMHYYGLPEEQNFNMMFVRNDILADLGVEIPKSWDDVESTIATLQANNMQIGMSNDYRVFLYQEGSQLFADEGMRINLDSNVALNSFEYMCSLYTDYSFPYKYDFSNRFRTGEMPIGIAGYNGTYNQLIVFATEIRGQWSFYPLPGIATYKQDNGNFVLDDNGERIVESINNMAIATVSAISMISGCENVEGAWDFMKWHVGAECQVNYSNEMVAILGDSAKYATANVTALESMPWTSDEYRQLSTQFNNLASIPNYPGSYIIGRYTQFAFLAAYDKKANPVDELNKYINTINKEITRKREEFKLETLEIGQSLADKRIMQATEIIDAIGSAEQSKYKDVIADFRRITSEEYLGTYKAYVSNEKLDVLNGLIKEMRETQYSQFFLAADYLETAAQCLKDYQKSYDTGLN